MQQPIIKTHSLVLMPFNVEDGKEVQTLADNYNVAKTTLEIPHPYLDGIAESWITSVLHKWRTRTGVAYAVRLPTSNQLVGVVSLMDIKQHDAKLGYWIGEPYWGQGYCTEAAKALVNFAMKELDITYIMAEHVTSNPASGCVMQKIGMEHMQSTRRPDRNGGYVDVEIYALKASRVDCFSETSA